MDKGGDAGHESRWRTYEDDIDSSLLYWVLALPINWLIDCLIHDCDHNARTTDWFFWCIWLYTLKSTDGNCPDIFQTAGFLVNAVQKSTETSRQTVPKWSEVFKVDWIVLAGVPSIQVITVPRICCYRYPKNVCFFVLSRLGSMGNNHLCHFSPVLSRQASRETAADCHGIVEEPFKICLRSRLFFSFCVPRLLSFNSWLNQSDDKIYTTGQPWAL